MMQRLVLATCVALLGGSDVGLAAHPALAATLCAGGSGCSISIQQALNHAQNGDTIQIGKGTFVGGITVTKSVTIIGAGSGATIIKGGGPVVTIGTPNAATEPTVSLTGLTVTAGMNTTVPNPWDAEGGGIYVPPSANGGNLTTVTITNSVIGGNSAQSLVGDGAVPISRSTSRGGGIANSGTMTLVDSTVSGNAAVWHVSPAPNIDQAEGGGIANTGTGTLVVRNSSISSNSVNLVTTEPTQGAVADAGGILNQLGTLTITNSTVAGNTVTSTTAPVSQFDVARGGGIFNIGTLGMQGSRVSTNAVVYNTPAVQPNMFASGGGIDSGGPLTVDSSTVSGNSVAMSSTSTDPAAVVFGVGGGIHADDNGSGTIRNSTINANTVTATVAAGFSGAAAGGVDDDNAITLLGDTVANNAVSTMVASAQPAVGSSADGGGMEVDGAATIAGTVFTGNSVTATSPAADFGPPLPSGAPSGTVAFGGAVAFTGNSLSDNNTVTDSIVSANRVQSSSSSGGVLAVGGGITNDTALTVRNTTISNNVGIGNGPSGFAQGGGVWNSDLGGAASQLTLINSAITRNSLTGTSGITIQGAGLYNDKANGTLVTQTNSVIAQNSPDQCLGC